MTYLIIVVLIIIIIILIINLKKEKTKVGKISNALIINAASQQLDKAANPFPEKKAQKINDFTTKIDTIKRSSEQNMPQKIVDSLVDENLNQSLKNELLDIIIHKTLNIGPSSDISRLNSDSVFFKYYKEIFFNELLTFGCFSIIDVQKMYNFIQAQSKVTSPIYYYKEIYKIFFEVQDWRWPLYEKWHKIIIETPAILPRIYDANYIYFTVVSDPCFIYNKLKVAELKEAIILFGVAFNQASKKDDLIKILLNNVIYDALKTKYPKISEIENKEKEKLNYAIYEKFLTYVFSKALNKADIEYYKAKNIQYFYNIDNLAEIALKEDNKDFPPFFPGDLTSVDINVC